jgi:excisionase family DNA binding protein
VTKVASARKLADNTTRLASVSEVAEQLGVSVRHLRRLVAGNRIPFIKLGRLIRFDPRELEAWLVGARVPARDGSANTTANTRTLSTVAGTRTSVS